MQANTLCNRIFFLLFRQKICLNHLKYKTRIRDLLRDIRVSGIIIIIIIMFIKPTRDLFKKA